MHIQMLWLAVTALPEKVIKEVDFPEELIINRSVEERKNFLISKF